MKGLVCVCWCYVLGMCGECVGATVCMYIECLLMVRRASVKLRCRDVDTLRPAVPVRYGARVLCLQWTNLRQALCVLCGVLADGPYCFDEASVMKCCNSVSRVAR